MASVMLELILLVLLIVVGMNGKILLLIQQLLSSVSMDLDKQELHETVLQETVGDLQTLVPVQQLSR